MSFRIKSARENVRARQDVVPSTNGIAWGKRLSTATALAGIVVLGLSAPVHAADNASVTRVEFAFDGACTAASPTTFGTTVQYTGATEDANGEDYVQIYHLDGNNTVVSRHTGSGTTHGATIGQTLGSNAFTRIVATPATGPYTAVLWDSTGTDFDFSGGETMDLGSPQVIASLAFDMNALDSDCPGGAGDTTPPQLASIERSTPADEFTNNDFLVWRVTFDEDVQGLDTNDFAISGTTASIDTVTAGSGASEYSVRATGGDLATLDGVVSLSISGSATIEDTSGNSLTNTAATGATETYTLDNTAPTVTFTNGTPDLATGAFQLTVTLSEEVDQFSTDGITVGNGTLSNIVTVSGTVYTATVTPTTRTTVTIDMPFGWAVDFAGNINSAATQLVVDVSVDTTPPTVALTSSATSPTNAPFTVTATFSEDVTGFDVGDLTVGNGAASNFQAVSARVYTATITPVTDGDVTIDIAAGAAMDLVGNDSESGSQILIAFDSTAPSAAITSSASGTVNGAFDVTVTFSEDVTGFEATDLTVGNGAASNLNAASATVYTATITPDLDGAVMVDVAAGAAQDAAGNDSTAATQFSVTYISDIVPPEPTISLPGSTTEGPFTATFTFSEDVTGFELSDLSVANGTASDFASTSASAYSATITPTTVGELTVSLAEGAAQDGAGNDSTAASASLDVVFPSTDSSLNLGDSVVDPTSVDSSVTLSNPGSAAIGYTTSVDVGWASVTPASGTIPGSGSLNLTIGLTAAADQLEAGTYNGTVTVTSTSPSATIATIPVALTVAPRFGSIQIVATTPGGTQGNSTFTYASGDADLNGLSLTTTGGNASSASFRKRFGSYDVTQSLPTGWELDNLTCTGDADGGSTIDAATGRADIDLDPNETIVCTFANSRDDAAVRLATQRAINNYLVRRGDRIVSAQPDIASRLRGRNEMRPGNFAADATRGEFRVAMNGSLSGLINHASASRAQMPGETRNEEQRFDVWFAADYSSISDDRAGDSAESEFGIVQLGVDFALDDDTIVGFMVQRDWMDETQETIATAAGGIAPAQIDGAGWMVGPYAAKELDNGIIVDVLALFGQSDNDINPLGFYTDNFETDRYLIRANISGEWVDGSWRVRPSASLSHFEETQEAYTDSLGITIPEQSVSIGRLTVGPEVAYRTENPDGGYWEVHGQLNANFDYDPASLMDATGRVFDTGQFRADAALGIRGQMHNGAVASFEVNLSGFGEDDFEATGARFEVRIPFGG